MAAAVGSPTPDFNDQSLHYRPFAQPSRYASSTYEREIGELPAKQRRVEKDGLGLSDTCPLHATDVRTALH